MSAEDRVERTRLLYERVVFGGDADALDEADRTLDSVEADLLLARGRAAHARYLQEGAADTNPLGYFERASSLYVSTADIRGQGEAALWIGIVHQVVHDDDDAAVPFLERSLDLATRSDDDLTRSYALRHLGIAAHRAGRLEEARERLEESVRLRRAIGFMAGVAANLVGLIHIAAAQGRTDDALELAAEANAIAEAEGADLILRQVDEASAAVARL